MRGLKMQASEHLKETAKFAIYPDAFTGNIKELMYLVIGLCDESGEVAGKIKKMYRDGTDNKDAVLDEIGDVYWYLHQLIRVLGADPEQVLRRNFDKLNSRAERGVLGGSGDNR